MASIASGTSTFAQQEKRPFTVADDISLTLFAPQGGGTPEVHFSPDGKYFVVWTERGVLERNCVEDTLRIYRSQDAATFLKNRDIPAPRPEWSVKLSGKHYPVIGNWRWLGDSSGIAFLRGNAGDEGQQELVLADLRKRVIVPLTSRPEQIQAFDVRDQRHFVYVVADHSEWEKRREQEARAAAYVGTGKSLSQLLFPDNALTRQTAPATKRLWAVIDGQRFQVKHNGAPLDLQELAVALSPDGKWLAAITPVEEVPTSWEKLYSPPPFLSYGGGGVRPQHSIAAGRGTANQFVRIDLKSGAIESLADAPSMDSVGIFGGSWPAWSHDGQEILLPGTFLKASENEPTRPCVAIVDLQTKVSACVASLKEGYTQITDPGDNYHTRVDIIVDARFAHNNHQVKVTFDTRDGSPGRTEEYRQDADGSWRKLGETLGAAETGPAGLQVRIKESFQEAPLLTASNKGGSRVLWDPNPQLKEMELGKASLYKWKSSDGREWEGGLYKPAGYEDAKRYPLVIQTHGFIESEFLPSGLYSAAFATREMAVAGIIVLQTAYGDRDCEMETVNEASCEVGMITSAANQLISDGLADPEKIGIIGFSRTCYYVMEALTTTSLRYKAALVTSGVMADYFQFVSAGGFEDFEKVIGAKPFGEGLQEWLKRSPGFNLDKVNTPLLIGAEGIDDVLNMWLPYAGLHYLKRPVDLIVLNTEEHVLTNPRVRMTSQGGSVDWFRFWLQGCEDPEPTKAAQYERWRKLRDGAVQRK
ncbi:MAG TPA: prolyl oligopeptidase family serine peptidase [Candidatus Bathyarchaeia archaeon]|nr:prolyl oligopeptidase family serine peptidase [Candidatus Bathyarchaeia archaeon]